VISGEEVLGIWSMCVTETEKFFPCGTRKKLINQCPVLLFFVFSKTGNIFEIKFGTGLSILI
jgi:hypothetical protein